MENKKDFAKEIIQELKEVKCLEYSQDEIILYGISKVFGSINTIACC